MQWYRDMVGLFPNFISGDSNGIRLHLCDVALDEFQNVVSKEEDTKIATEAYLIVLKPFLALLQNEKNDAVHARLVDQFEKMPLQTNNLLLSYSTREENVCTDCIKKF